MQKFIQTPFYMFNSKYDQWQLGNELQTSWKTKDEQNAVLQYGKDFLVQFAPVQQEPRNGAFITSCICHGCGWQDLALDGKTAYAHFGEWLAGKAAESIHIDTRGPNGDGKITRGCAAFLPSQEAVLV